MKAAVCYEFGAPLSVEEVALAAPQQGEVKVRVAATAICHSDIHVIRGEWGRQLPIIVGHETAGFVEAVGDGVTLVQPGDRVVVSLLRACGRCFYCAAGESYLCEGKFPLDTNTRLHNMGGEPIVHGLSTAGFAEYVIVDQSQAVRIAEDIPLDRAALLACGVLTGVGAAVNTARVRPGASVGVIGAGGVGLNAIQGAALAGAARIVALDTLDTKLTAASAFGATDTLNASRDDLVPVVRALTGGRGLDDVLVTVGSAPAITQGLTLLRPGGTLVVVGIPGRHTTAPVPIFPLVTGNRRVLGSFMGAARLRRDIPWLVDLYRQGRLKLDELISARYPLEQINEAIAATASGESRRNLIVFDVAS